MAPHDVAYVADGNARVASAFGGYERVAGLFRDCLELVQGVGPFRSG